MLFPFNQSTLDIKIERKEMVMRHLPKNLFFVNSLLITCVLIASVPSYGATISGTVKYSGEAPKFKPIKMDADPICLSKHTAPIYPQTLMLGEGNTMANVFVYVKNGLAKKDYPVPGQEAVITQHGCQYEPHIVGVMVGQPVKILNPDGTLHNVHALCKINQEFNLAMPKFRTETVKVFAKEEFMFPIKCDVHPWMGAWISVMPHPHFAVTKEDGKFSIANLPAGTYTIEAWQEKLGTQTSEVTVGGEEAKEINFTFTRPAKE